MIDMRKHDTGRQRREGVWTELGFLAHSRRERGGGERPLEIKGTGFLEAKASQGVGDGRLGFGVLWLMEWQEKLCEEPGAGPGESRTGSTG